MSRSLFLFGDQHDNFGETSRPFIEAAGGGTAKIAVLTAGGPKAQPYVARITAPWQQMGVEVVTIGPEEYAGEPDEGMAQAIRQCDGIFMCGGETRHLQRIYVASALGDLIRDMYSAGVPFAGVSAGALLAAEQCAAWGGIVTTPTNEYYVRYRGCYEELDGDKTAIQLELDKGLGLVHDCVFEPHFSEMGGFPRLVTVMQWTGVTHGYGLDEPICLVIEDGRPTRVLGQGRLYHLERTVSDRFELTVYEPGAEF